MTVLSAVSIRGLCEGKNDPLIENFEPSQLATAGYDLRVGEEFSLPRRFGTQEPPMTVRTFDKACSAVVVEPGEMIFLTAVEKINMPDHLVGHVSLKLRFLMQGVMMASQSQIDAGYSGAIWCLLHNLSGERLVMGQGDSIMRLEFLKTDKKCEPYGGDYGDKTLATAIRTPANSSVHESMMIARQAEKDLRRYVRIGSFIGIPGVLVALAAIMITIVSPFADAASQARQQADQAATETQKAEERIEEQAKVIAGLQSQIDQLKIIPASKKP